MILCSMRVRDLSHVKIESVDIASAGGTLRALYYHAGNASQTCVVLCHGYSSSKHNVDPLAFYLAVEGTAALALDFQGHKLGASSTPLRSASDLRLNALDAVAYARSRAAKVVLAGHSMGAATAIGATLESDAVSGLIVMATALGRNRTLNAGGVLGGLRNRAAYVDGPTPDEITAQMDAFTARIAAVAPRPLLVIAGSKDAIVGPSAVRGLFDAASEPKTFEIIDATHTDCVERSKFVVMRWLRERGFSESRSNA
ncbi:MAG: lysophospholipase [Candidatus Eremiobacteraeota bacterium]|nr:lysophospholipase [Candidatus Eremiobacteraeota bacterium]